MSIGPKKTEGESESYYGAILVQQLLFSLASFLFVLGGINFIDIIFIKWKVGDLALPLASAVLAIQFQEFFRRYFFTFGRVIAAFLG